MIKLHHEKTSKLLIVGEGEFAEIAADYFLRDSKYEVAAFTAERDFIKRNEIHGRAVVPFEDVERQFPPAEYEVFVAMTYTKLNRLRARLLEASKAKGYTIASYVSSHAFVWHNVEIGENSFVFENNVIQYGASIGRGVILWSGSHIGHRVRIGDHAFVSSNVGISGFCEIGSSCFLGINSCLADRVKIGDDCVIGAGAVVLRSTEPRGIYRGNPATRATVSSHSLYGISE